MFHVYHYPIINRNAGKNNLETSQNPFLIANVLSDVEQNLPSSSCPEIYFNV